MAHPNIICIIPARIGSKRLYKKNILPINGKPMIQYAIDAAKETNIFDKAIYITTESNEIIDIVKPMGIQIIERPNSLAEDLTWTQPVINHAIKVIGNIEDEDIIVILQANSPEITGKLIINCLNMLHKNNLWQVHTTTNAINNGAVHVMKAKVCRHQGKVNYNGYLETNLIDIHTQEDYEKARRRMQHGT